ncbi:MULTISPECIES: hypothetical protein [unclassified Streptomyces]|nr:MULTISPECIES: hypothetical protein [unclassified Streptomyces]MCX4550551.1 hypothetical protein [Streptomyces sp. NBC_01500]WSC21998.1 hypothetical protein OIE60_21220 [Streptomyces sp. NBC_01766]
MADPTPVDEDANATAAQLLARAKADRQKQVPKEKGRSGQS